MAKSLIESKKIVTPIEELRVSIKTAIDILNNIEGIEVAFWARAIEVLEPSHFSCIKCFPKFERNSERSFSCRTTRFSAISKGDD